MKGKRRMSQSEYVTKGHFDTAVSVIRRDIRDVISHFNKSQAAQNERLNKIEHRLDRMEKWMDGFDDHFEEIDAKLTAIMEMLTTRKELRNLIRELKAKGIVLDESKIFLN